MSLKEKNEKEYDEDLEELLGEDYLEEEGTEELEEDKVENIDYQENNSVTLITDTDIEKNISSFLAWGTAIKWLFIIVGALLFIFNLVSNGGVLVGIIMLIIFIIYGFLSSMFLKWFSYILKCLYDIRNK